MNLRSLELRRNVPFIDRRDRHFFEMVREGNLSKFKFCQNPQDKRLHGMIINFRSDALSLTNDRLLGAVSFNTNLTSLSLRGVVLREGNGIAPLIGLSNLKELCLSSTTPFERSDLEILSSIQSLERLALFNCSHLYNQLDMLNSLTNLRELSLLKVALCGNDIESISQLNLKRVNIYGHLDSDVLLPFRNITSLEHLSLQLMNKVPPSIITQIGSLVNLKSLCLQVAFLQEDLENNNALPLEQQDNQDEEAAVNVAAEDQPPHNDFDNNIIHSDEESTFVGCSDKSSASSSSSSSSSSGDDTDDDEEDDNESSLSCNLSSLSNLTGLQSLELYDTVVTDNFMNLIGSKLTTLTSLTIWSCYDLSEQSVIHLSKLRSLETLSIGGYASLKPSSLDKLACLDSLKRLEFYHCLKLSKASLKSLRLMKKLRKVIVCPYHEEDSGLPSHIELEKYSKSADLRMNYLERKRHMKGLF